MNIQIFGKTKCFDTKKAERYFKERGVKFQSIDLQQKPMSPGEFQSIAKAVGGYQQLIDEDAKDKDLLALLKYLGEANRADKLFENQKMIRTPIVRNGRQATIGFQPDVWKTWD
jgi:arsenate reductase (glutaredoxin)